MKRKITLSEADLHNIIKESVKRCLMELDWRTYASAYDKSKNPQQSNRFKDAATQAFNQQNGYGIDANGNPTGNDVYGGGMLYAPGGTYFGTQSGKYNNNTGEFDKTYSSQTINQLDHKHNKRGEAYKDFYGQEPNQDTPKSHTLNPKLKMAQMKGDKQVRDFYQGKSNYVKGKGWK